MAKVKEDQYYPVRNYNEQDLSYTYQQVNIRPPPPNIQNDKLMINKTPTDVKFIVKPDNFNEIKPVVIYPEDEDLSPPVYRQVIDESKINIAGKYYKRTDLTGKLSTR